MPVRTAPSGSDQALFAIHSRAVLAHSEDYRGDKEFRGSSSWSTATGGCSAAFGSGKASMRVAASGAGNPCSLVEGFCGVEFRFLLVSVSLCQLQAVVVIKYLIGEYFIREAVQVLVCLSYGDSGVKSRDY